ncbi:hypothetical protein Tco_1581877, partial [Tanacetum coccineum]
GARLELGVSVRGCSTEGRVVSIRAGLDRRCALGSYPEICLDMSVSHSWRDVTNANSNATLEPIPLIKELDEEADALPTIAPTEAPHSRNHIKSPWTQNTSTEDVPSDR